jgi:ABC-type transport system substrate-binding protein
MFSKAKNVTAVVILVLVSAFAGVLAVHAEEEVTVVYGQSISLTDLDPAYGAYLNYPAGYEAAYCIYDGLVTFDENLNIVPALATSWEVSEDKLAWTFYLREGVSFHDGTPFNAEAVKVNFIRGMDPSRTTTNRPQWDPWEKVEVLSEYSIRVTSSEPFGIALNALAHGAGHMVSPAAIESYNDHPEHHPIGTGPYKVEKFDVGRELVLVANEDYWGEPPGVDKLVFRYLPEPSTRIAALLAGEVDIIDQIPPHDALRLQKDDNFQVITTAGLRPYIFHVALFREHLQDKMVRKALNYALSKEAIAKALFLDFARIVTSPLASPIFSHLPMEPYSYNPQKALQLLTDAGWSDSNGDGILDSDGNDFEINIMVTDGWLSKDAELAEIAANQWGDLGIKTSITKIEKAAFFGEAAKPLSEVEWDMFFFPFNPSNASAQYHLENLYQSNPSPTGAPRAFNVSRYSNPQVDSLIIAARQAVDDSDRRELLQDAQRVIWDECPSIWFVEPQIIAVAHKDVSGVVVWPTTFLRLRGVCVR